MKKMYVKSSKDINTMTDSEAKALAEEFVKNILFEAESYWWDYSCMYAENALRPYGITDDVSLDDVLYKTDAFDKVNNAITNLIDSI